MKKAILILMAVALLVFSGCNQGGQVECNSDSDCGSPLVCVNNHCVRYAPTPCNSLNPCKGADETCEEGICVKTRPTSQ